MRRASLAVLVALILASAPFTHAQRTIEFTTDKPRYDPGDTMTVTGTTIPNTAVVITVFNPRGELIAISQDVSNPQGNFQVQVMRFPSQLDPDKFIAGVYRVRAQIEGAFTEVTVIFASEAPPPPPLAGIKVEVRESGDRYTFVTRNDSIGYRIEIFRSRPEFTIAYESSPGVFNESNKVSVELTRGVEFVDSNGDGLYRRGVDTDVRSVSFRNFAWNSRLRNSSETRYEYHVNLTASDGPTTVTIDAHIIGGALRQEITYEIKSFQLQNPSNLLALVLEGRGEGEMQDGPGEIGFNIPLRNTVISPYYSLDPNGVAGGIRQPFQNRIGKEDEDIHQPQTQRLVYVTIPRILGSAKHVHTIGVRTGAPVPEFPPLGVFLTLAVLIPLVILVGRNGSFKRGGGSTRDRNVRDWQKASR